jgi:hypothetical protein
MDLQTVIAKANAAMMTLATPVTVCQLIASQFMRRPACCCSGVVRVAATDQPT